MQIIVKTSVKEAADLDTNYQLSFFVNKEEDNSFLPAAHSPIEVYYI